MCLRSKGHVLVLKYICWNIYSTTVSIVYPFEFTCFWIPEYFGGGFLKNALISYLYLLCVVSEVQQFLTWSMW